MVVLKCLIALVAAAAFLPSPTQAVNPYDIKLLEFLNPILDAANAFFNHQRLSNENGTKNEFRQYLLEDESNEKMGRATVQEFITRAGYLYDLHKVISIDGYITQVFRLINPLANSTQLRKPPVIFLHGGLTDPTSWLWASNIQHHPERYPRSASDGPITSSNRSLPFVLANNGYDVWMVTTRGSNKQNRGHTKLKTQLTGVVGESLAQVAKDRLEFWRFSMNELIEHEFPAQIDKVLEVTQSDKFSIVAISIGTMVTTPLLASNEKYAAKIHNYVALGTPFSVQTTNNLIKLLCTLGFSLPYELLITLFTEVITSPLTQNILLALGSRKRFRYSLVWIFFAAILGSSPTFQTGLENPVVGHVLQATGLNYGVHYCQQTAVSRYQKFDHGPKKNLAIYNSTKPPVYDTSNLKLKNGWLLISASNDNLASPKSIAKLIEAVRPRPKHIQVRDFNHFDLVAAMQNDIYVNLPVLEYLNSFQPADSGL